MPDERRRTGGRTEEQGIPRKKGAVLEYPSMQGGRVCHYCQRLRKCDDDGNIDEDNHLKFRMGISAKMHGMCR